MNKLHSFLASCMQTQYTVDVPEGEPVTLTIGSSNPNADRLLRRFHATTYAYLTAFNPHSTSLSKARNLQRHKQLCNELRERGFTFLTGKATPVTGDWEPETCVFVFNMSRSIAREVCQNLAQDGAIVGDWGSAPKLLFTDPKLRRDFLALLRSCVLD